MRKILRDRSRNLNREVWESPSVYGGEDVKPEIFRLEGYVFFFYANEGNEPMHVHVRRGGGYAKFWLEPLELDYAKGLKTKEIVRAEVIITENIEIIRRKWHDVFGT
ncbi:Genome sequencing data, contig C313 (modular protein) [Microcystis aeruginosa PCC 9806]|uniref:DUF4160 domain-containing protein n=3 Tax=Microcystis aeruginosa TaxID=1126 RepID=A0A510PNT9_MICAE|nr:MULTISPECIES: DUF4160 domain-containing protein [Microcystis]MCZ8116839.1 DUF4160 domain-containing protein [Microcystis sp. LE18-22.4A]GCA95359.1 DUF4160 domain-containing protein [Microcystis aeruginosa 11-30S32]CCI14544.1 Genome sequencing data, contig C313 (modular protein) [Microcystis aeruginosa PCC 9806]